MMNTPTVFQAIQCRSATNGRGYVKRLRRKRRGNIVVLTAFMLVVMIGMLAFALDLGVVCVARTELQRSADAAAVAAAWELVDLDAVYGSTNPTATVANARDKAGQFASLNSVLTENPVLSTTDVTVGYIENPFASGWQLQTDNVSLVNAVKVRVRRSADQNGKVPLLFGRVLGFDDVATEADATAALLVNVKGFRIPGTGENLGILPFALDEETWNDMLAGGGTDDWTWDAEDEEIQSGGDGIREVNLYPQDVGVPGNRGTVDIGGSNNSTADIARQIVDGVNEDDMSHMPNNEIALDENGELILNGDTGISAGVKDELESVKGEPRIIPIFRSVTGPGNNAMYTIVGFVGVRILEVKLTGSNNSKRVIIQPANMVLRGAIPAEGDEQVSHFIYSPVWLVD